MRGSLPSAGTDATPTTAGATRAPPPVRVKGAATPLTDRVELSEAATSREPISEQRLSEVRRQIQAGTYLTDAKLDVVADRLIRELLG